MFSETAILKYAAENLIWGCDLEFCWCWWMSECPRCWWWCDAEFDWWGVRYQAQEPPSWFLGGDLDFYQGGLMPRSWILRSAQEKWIWQARMCVKFMKPGQANLSNLRQVFCSIQLKQPRHSPKPNQVGTHINRRIENVNQYHSRQSGSDVGEK